MSTGSLDLVAVGSAVIDHIHRVTVLPARDTGVYVLNRQSGPGGVEGNVAAAAARLGLRVGVITRVGCDAAGTMVLDDFRQRGIDVLRVQVGGEDETAYTLVFVDGHGDRSMVTGGHGVRGLTLDEDDDAYIRRARVCFTSGYLPSPLLHRVAGLCAGDQGPALAFDLPGSFDDLEGRGLQRTHVDTLLPVVDLFLTNREHLRSYTGEETLADGLAYLNAKGVRRASVSDGERGLFLFEAGNGTHEVHVVPGFHVRVVDTTGAGDVLSAALILAWLLENRPAAEAGRFAAAAAALSCTGWGVRTALPSWPDAAALAGCDEGDWVTG
ncbi:MAG: carbohydrate kinase family protein [Thermomicrobiales bacterium]|jgi:ribokinase/sulfofructose kinase|nr:carbohydrate kinase family protein [Thermomicrobiales bacterium]MDF2748633.1 carbohydrate kinase family protein [Propionibacteriaceae bacterium]